MIFHRTCYCWNAGLTSYSDRKKNNTHSLIQFYIAEGKKNRLHVNKFQPLYNILIILLNYFLLVMLQQCLTAFKFNFKWVLMNLRQADPTSKVPNLVTCQKRPMCFVPWKPKILLQWSPLWQISDYIFLQRDYSLFWSKINLFSNSTNNKQNRQQSNISIEEFGNNHKSRKTSLLILQFRVWEVKYFLRFVT